MQCKGPYVFLRSVGKGGSTLELMSDNVEVRPMAVGYVIPFRGRLEDVAMPSEQAVRVKCQCAGNIAWCTLNEVVPLSPRGGSEWSDKADALSLTSSDED